jgi:hypothetical protein
MLRMVGLRDQKNHVTTLELEMATTRLWDHPLVGTAVVRDLAHLLLHGTLATLLPHVVEMSLTMNMAETHRAEAGVMIAAVVEDVVMTIDNAVLPAVVVAHLLQQGPMELLANG